jgi:hypothetical protein
MTIQRRRATVIDSSGKAILRVEIPRIVWDVASAFASRVNIRSEQGLDFLLMRIASMLSEDGSDFLGPEWREPLKQVVAAGMGVLEGPAIDLRLLHTSPKTKSGYVGVYANGQGFRAMGRDPVTGTQAYLGTKQTAEAAAWLRYLHYKRNGLPYGELELEIETYRKRFNLTGSDETVIALIREDATRDGYLHVLFPDEGPGSKTGQIEPKMVGFDVPPDTSEYEK